MSKCDELHQVVMDHAQDLIESQLMSMDYKNFAMFHHRHATHDNMKTQTCNRRDLVENLHVLMVYGMNMGQDFLFQRAHMRKMLDLCDLVELFYKNH